MSTATKWSEASRGDGAGAAPTPDTFPTLRIRRDGFEARGDYAVAQARYLRPDPVRVAALDAALQAANAGVVAHFYMDPELQGVLAACRWPHIHVSDSLVMADKALAMVEAGASAIVVLGVDFMAENARAVLDAAGHEAIPLLRVSAAPIGCSLAEAADSAAYHAYLLQAAATQNALHVVYINTSLRAKALAESLVPTIAVTSSNVVRTVLQAFAQVPDVEVFFGPDTYMGHNLRALFAGAVALGDAACAALHPAHDAASIAAAMPRLHTFEQGACVVHHLFGREVTAQVARDYGDAFLTAHLEVPGEMFALAAAAAQRGRGVVGSTSQILQFIERTLASGAADGQVARYVLGTEAGMVTPIAHSVQRLLAARQGAEAVDIVFPVAAEAVAASDDPALGVVPGVAGGEGCSTAGGCATCPYMKMNTLDGALHALRLLAVGDAAGMAPLRPANGGARIALQDVATLGVQPIAAMRIYGATGALPDTLVARTRSRLAPTPT